jgi:hypothetical protein
MKAGIPPDGEWAGCRSIHVLPSHEYVDSATSKAEPEAASYVIKPSERGAADGWN